MSVIIEGDRVFVSNRFTMWELAPHTTQKFKLALAYLVSVDGDPLADKERVTLIGLHANGGLVISSTRHVMTVDLDTYNSLLDAMASMCSDL